MINYLLAILISFFVGMIIAPSIVKFVKKLKVKQTILSYVHQHKDKEGNATMGGLIFIIPSLITSLIFGCGKNEFSLFALFVMLCYGIIGFLDDFLKVKFKRNLGLKAYQKIISQLIIAFIASYYAFKNNFIGPIINIPVFEVTLNLKWWYIPFSMFIYIALTNSVNLTDGLDGLAGNTCSIYFAVFVVIIYLEIANANNIGRTLYARELESLLMFVCCLLGGLTAFLWFNSFKAKIFMGDIGSLALGGVAAVVAMLTKNPFLILVIGIMFVVSSISVIVQVIFFKLKNKRILLMAPFHHHLELKGIKEPKIVSYYSIITLIGGVVGLIIM